MIAAYARSGINSAIWIHERVVKVGMVKMFVFLGKVRFVEMFLLRRLQTDAASADDFAVLSVDKARFTRGLGGCLPDGSYVYRQI